MSNIFFFKVKSKLALRKRERLKEFIEHLFAEHNRTVLNLNYIIVKDEELNKINYKYLNHNTLTDVITFSFSENKTVINGEVYISSDRIIENAKLFKCTANEELHRVIFHGALHLCGYKDKTRKDQTEMRRKENLYMNKYFGSVSRETN